ncbi:DUF167 family protein [Sphingomonas sp. HITSZ_GF]|uniref:DUF167 domain-containing protein n=1 Tax=Sphingomonas sp. HITSZ_GF TaxID=3037247 RepID=UPI00240E8822|nr:DUF167 family protein [Sphingomonas sp. HITSZ_GF]MDG2534556.1 DUF167 family protein [Sphingomonas sp. HITSZ_GF]
MPAWRRIANGIEIAVRVTPRASRDAFAAGTEDHFAARLAAPPVEGAANAALMPLVAKAFGVPKRAVALIAGDTARLKRLRVEGDPLVLEAIAQRLYGGSHDG